MTVDIDDCIVRFYDIKLWVESKMKNSLNVIDLS